MNPTAPESLPPLHATKEASKNFLKTRGCCCLSFCLSSRRDLLLSLPLLLPLPVLSQPTKQTSSRPKAAHFAAAVERSLYFVFVLVLAPLCKKLPCNPRFTALSPWDCRIAPSSSVFRQFLDQ